MSRQVLCGARVFTGDHFLDDHAVLIDRDRIAGVAPRAAMPADVPVRDLGGGLLAPGFIDAQVNGGGGVLFNDTPTAAAATAIAVAHRRYGTTGLLPTYITDRADGRQAAVAAVRDALAGGAPGVLGIHLEGPFLSKARKGAHDPDLIVPLTDRDADEIAASRIGTVLVTVAAENAAPAQIRRLAEAGVIVSLGHSDATFEVARGAADAGARGVTHLFNAMSQFAHRAPGLVGAALDHGGLWCGFIADGHHVHDAALRTALRAKRGPARLFFVSDAMSPAGVDATTFRLSGRTVTRTAGKLQFDDGTLAGADLTMDAAVRHAVDHLEVPLAEALRMASLYPAAFLRLDRSHGRIAPGFRADLVHLAPTLAVERVWVGGTAYDA